jgi:hypothetical protein
MEIALHRDVLSARTGMLRNYDPLVREENALREALGRLRDNASGDAEEAAAIDRFAAAATRQEELTEQFKSNNALLQILSLISDCSAPVFPHRMGVARWLRP